MHTLSVMRVKNITDYLEKEQVDQVLGAAHQCSAREYLMLPMLWRTGVRVNELLTITPRDIEPHNNVINVTRAKGGKQQRVHFDAETIKMLSEYGSAQQLPMIDLYLPSNNDRCETSPKRCGSVIGKDVHPYTSRHSYAIHCAKRLGHTTAAAGARALEFEHDDGVSAV